MDRLEALCNLSNSEIKLLTETPLLTSASLATERVFPRYDSAILR